MEIVKGVAIVIAVSMLGVACEDRRDADAPTPKPESPLKTVDEIIANVEGVKPPEKPVEPTGENKPAEEPEAPKIPVAQPVPDKPGFVISPYNGKWIDVTGVKPGTLMADPHFTEEKKFFRVPEIPVPAEVEASGEEESDGAEEAVEAEESAS